MKVRNKVLRLVFTLAILFLLWGPVMVQGQSQCSRDAVVYYHGAGITGGWKFTVEHPLYFAWWEVWSYESEVSAGFTDPESSWAVVHNIEKYSSIFTILYPTVSVLLKKYPYAGKSEDVTVELWHVEADGEGHYCHVDQLGESYHLDTTTWNDEWRWITVTGTAMLSGEVYAVEVVCNDGAGNYVVWGYDEESPFVPCGVVPHSGEGCEGFGAADGRYYVMMVQGCWSVPLSVLTEDGYIDSSGRVVLGGLVTNMGVETGVECYMDFGFAEELGDVELVDTIHTIFDSNRGHYEYVIDSWPSNTTLYYQARIVGEVGNETAVGAIKSIYLPTVIPRIGCEVIENNAYNLTFETIISSIDDQESVSLNLTYSQDMACYNDTSELCMHEAVTEGGRYLWSDSPGGVFDYGERYSFYATMCFNGSVMVRSDLRQFTRYDPSKPGWQNWLQDWLDEILGPDWSGTIDFGWLWWGLAAVLGLIVFVAVSRKGNWRLGCAWGLVCGCALLYFLVALGFVNVWLVVLLSIVAGYIIYKVIFAGARSGRA